MKYLVLGFILLFTGCGAIDRSLANVTGDGSETCHAGVKYLQFTSGASVMYEQNGSIALCKESK